MHRAASFVAGYLLLSAVSAVHGAGQSQPLFADDSPLSITITGPLSTMQRERSMDDYYAGHLSYIDDSGEVITLELKFRTRGKFRRQREICPFPPIRLNFRKEQVADTLFAGQDKLKLVSHCQPNSRRFEQYVLKELLAYRIYEHLSPQSFATRLLKITWVDTDRRHDAVTEYGFVIEHKDRLAERLDAQLVEVARIDEQELDRQHSARTYLFQYMIGNTDFSLLQGPPEDICCHNAVLFQLATGATVSIPYDFDMSGLVNAPYARPQPSLGIRQVTQRKWRGSCPVAVEFSRAAADVLVEEAAVLAMIEEQEGLNGRSRQAAKRFLAEFFRLLSAPDRLNNRLARDCS